MPATIMQDSADEFVARLHVLRTDFGDLADVEGPRCEPKQLGDLVIGETDGPEEAAGLFRGAFKAAPPLFPRHFVLRHSPTNTVIGYAHHTRAGPVHLAGGLVVAPLFFRRLDEATAALVRAHGGLAEWLGTVTCDCLETKAIFAYMGDRISINVNTRVGFVETGRPHLYVYWKHALSQQDRAALVDRIADFGAF